MELQDHVLKDLGRILGLSLNFDEHHQCLISLDKKTFISIKKQAEGFLFYGMLADLSNQPDATVFEKSLSLNLTLMEANRGAIVLDAQTRVTMLIKPVKADITAFALEEELAAFADSVENIAQLLAAIVRGDTTDKHDSLAFV